MSVCEILSVPEIPGPMSPAPRCVPRSIQIGVEDWREFFRANYARQAASSRTRFTVDRTLEVSRSSESRSLRERRFARQPRTIATSDAGESVTLPYDATRKASSLISVISYRIQDARRQLMPECGRTQIMNDPAKSLC